MAKKKMSIEEVERLRLQYMLSTDVTIKKVRNWNVYFDRHLAQPQLSVSEVAEKYKLGKSAIGNICRGVVAALDKALPFLPSDEAIEKKRAQFLELDENEYSERSWEIYVLRLLARESFSGADVARMYDIEDENVRYIYSRISRIIGPCAAEDMVSGDELLGQFLGEASDCFMSGKSGASVSAEVMEAMMIRSIPTDEAIEEKRKFFFEDNNSPNCERDWGIYLSVFLQEDKLEALDSIAAVYNVHASYADIIYKEVARKVGPYAPEDMVSGDDVLDLYLGMPSADLDG